MDPADAEDRAVEPARTAAPPESERLRQSAGARSGILRATQVPPARRDAGWCDVRRHLTGAYELCISICMRTTLHIDEDMLKQAAELTGVREKTALVRMGLASLIARESARRLARLGGTEPALRAVPRRRPT